MFFQTLVIADAAERAFGRDYRRSGSEDMVRGNSLYRSTRGGLGASSAWHKRFAAAPKASGCSIWQRGPVVRRDGAVRE